MKVELLKLILLMSIFNIDDDYEEITEYQEETQKATLKESGLDLRLLLVVRLE